MKQLWWLVCCHIIGDVAWQTKWLASQKQILFYAMFAHVMIWTACVSIGLEYIGKFALWKILFLAVGHWASDSVKQPSNSGMILDQLWHLLQCYIVWKF